MTRAEAIFVTKPNGAACLFQLAQVRNAICPPNVPARWLLWDGVAVWRVMRWSARRRQNVVEGR